MAPIKIVVAYVSYAAQTIFFFIGTTGNPVLPAYPTLVSANPVISINGVPDTVQGPFYSTKRASLPWVAYQLSKPITAQDIVTWTTPDKWCTASGKTCAIDAGQADNWSGQLEPGQFGYMAFNDPTKTVKVGFGAAGNVSGNVCSLKDIIHRTGNPWQSATISTSTGYPLTISQWALAGLWDVRNNNGLPGASNPTPQGTWIITADETNPTAPMILTLTSQVIPNSTSIATIIPGNLFNGVEYNKKWLFNVINPTGINLVMALKIATPDNKLGPNTLKNMHAFDPGNEPVVNPGLLSNNNFLRMQESSIPGINVPITRALTGWQGSQVFASDFPGANEQFSYSSLPPSVAWTTNNPTYTGNRVIPISGVRRYDLNVTPYVYAQAPYKRFSPSAVPGLAYQIKPADFGLDYQWISPGPGGTRNVVSEFVTSVPHNLQSGQLVILSAMTFKVISGAPATATTGGQYVVWVTSPTTFITAVWAASAPGDKVYGWVDDAQSVAGSATVYPIASGGTIEAMAYNSRALGGSAIWFGINHCMSDEGIRSLAQRLYNVTDRGTKIYIQFSNEILIPSYIWGWMEQISNLEGLSLTQADVQRTAEMHKIFTDIWGNDADSIVRIFQPWTVADGTLYDGLVYANANKIPIDVIAVAAYLEGLDSSPSFVQAAAAICADNPKSISFGKPLMPMAAYHDLVRHHVKYNRDWTGPFGIMAKLQTAFNKSGYGLGGNFTYARPKLCFYESALSIGIPTGVAPTDNSIRTGLTHDFIYHPNYYYSIQAFLQFCQNPGPGIQGADVAIIAGMTGGRSSAGDGPDGNLAAIWTTYNHQQSQRGFGLNNRFWATALGGDGKSHDDTNQSVSGQSYADWIAGAASRRN